MVPADQRTVSVMHGRAGSSIQDVTARHAEALMALPGVVSVGIGCNEKGVAVIVIGLEREAPGAARQLPDRIDGFEVRTEVVGRYRAQR